MKEKRTALGLTQLEISTAAGEFLVDNYGTIENGKNSPSIEVESVSCERLDAVYISY